MFSKKYIKISKVFNVIIVQSNPRGSVTIPGRRNFLLLECGGYHHSNKTSACQHRQTVQKNPKIGDFVTREKRKIISRLLKVVATRIWAQNDRNGRFHISTYNNSKL